MPDLRPILFVIGLLLSALGLAMLPPAAIDNYAGNPDWSVFLFSAGITLFVGVTLVLMNRTEAPTLSLRQAFLLTTLSWVAIPTFGALPLTFSELDLSYADAFFEAMSGITTTGATVITGLDTAPPGILIWRASLQWIGGIGIIVMAVAVLPMLQVGGMQLFRMESSDNSEKILPRAVQIVGGLSAVYLALTLLCTLSLWFAGMTAFEAMAHAMTTISTGGFSTSDASLGHFDSARIEYIVVLFMIAGSLPFVLYLQVLRGRPLRLWRDSQVRWFFVIAAASVLIMFAWQWLHNAQGVTTALRVSAFNVISIMTGTGYTTADYGSWGGFAVVGFFLLMFVGGCAGSTSCGIKIFRFQVLYASVHAQMRRLLQPHGVFVPHYNRQPVPDSVITSVMGFFFVFMACFGLLAVILGILGLDFLTAVSAAAATIANVGPGLGDIVGPAGTYKSLPDAAKWVLSLGMLLGRLELFTVLVLITPAFWRS